MEMILPLQEDIVAKTYNDMKGLIKKTVYRFYKRYGGDFEELQAEANLLFILSCISYRENKGNLHIWIRWCVWKGLLSYTKSLYKQIPKSITENEQNHQIIKMLEDKKSHLFSSLELFDGVGDDAKTIIHLIWNLPHDLPVKNGNHPCHVQTSLRKYLRDMGWTYRRIKETFEEVTKIIND